MAYTDHPNGAFLTRSGNYNVGKQVLDEEITLSRYIDCTTDNLTSGAFYKLFSVAAGFLLTEAYASCVATEGADTFDIVDDDSATTTFITNANMSAAGTVTATNARKYYAAAGFIVLRPDAALTTAKFYVTIKGVKLNTSM